MKLILILMFLTLISISSSFASEDCSSPFKNQDPVLLSKNYNAYQTPLQIQNTFTNLLLSGERLEYRASKNSNGEYQIPVVTTNTHGLNSPSAWVNLPTRIPEKIISHFQQSLDNNFAQYPFFSDMGHGHFYLPLLKAQNLPSLQENLVGRWQSIFNDPDLVILYHTREYYDFRSVDGNSELIPLQQNRNVLGSFNISTPLRVITGPGGEANTVRVIPEMFSAGTINFSASRKGCFPFRYNNETLFMDFAFHGLSVERSNAPTTIMDRGGR